MGAERYPIKVDPVLAERIRRAIDEHPEESYSGITEFVKDAIRRRLDELEVRYRERGRMDYKNNQVER